MRNKTRQKVYEFIKSYIEENHYPPTFREIGVGVGLRSTSTVYNHVHNLQELGMINTEEYKASSDYRSVFRKFRTSQHDHQLVRKTDKFKQVGLERKDNITVYKHRLINERSNMRTREKSYSDYGITKDEIKYIKDFCKNANWLQKKIINHALSELDSYVAPYTFDSLVKDMSYEDICAKNYLYIGKGDFYGHRRQGMAAIKRWMILYGIWEM